VVAVLHLDSEKKTALYDAAGKQKNSIPPDLPDYIMEHEYVRPLFAQLATLRQARKNGNVSLMI
jgi:hypothetical protein